MIFVAMKDDLMLEPGYRLSKLKVPQQAGSKEDGETIEALGSSS